MGAAGPQEDPALALGEHDANSDENAVGDEVPSGRRRAKPRRGAGLNERQRARFYPT